MILIQIGDNAPDIELPDSDGKIVTLKELKGRWVVIYFYPKDMTSGCTIEALDFTFEKAGFDSEGAVVLGISADSQESHLKFREKNNLKHSLLSDTEKHSLETYGVWQTKKLYGREFKGIVRTTFLIDPKGFIVYIWPKVKVEDHAQEVLKKIRELKK
jgi:thioredoxin-dependent peroxiredoxin